MFLFLGIAVAVFGMRLLFPILLVVFTAHIGPAEAWTMALNDPALYAAHMEEANPAIVGFAAPFLMMIFLDWLFEERDLHWLGGFERFLNRQGKGDIVASMIALATLAIVAFNFSEGHTLEVLSAGVLGWLAYQTVNQLDKLTEGIIDEESVELAEQRSSGNKKLATGVAGFILFMKLEMIDASFSFDGVSGAFAISSNIFAIMAGLGIGAFYIRSLTIHVTRTNTLGEYVFLDHGAHWAIGSLSVLMFVGLTVKLPEIVTGLFGVVIIAAAFISSLIYRRNNPAEVAEEAAEVDLSGLQSLPDPV